MFAITGGTGLLGAHVIYRLLDKGFKVKALHRETSSFDLITKVIGYYTTEVDEYMSRIDWRLGDVTDPVSLEDFLDEGDRLFHCAGVVSFQKSDRELLNKINKNGTKNVVNAALNSKVQKLVHASSTAALGRADADGSISEQSKWKNSKLNTWYAVTKMRGEQEVWRGQAEGLRTVIVNPGIILGPGSWDEGSSRLFSSVYNGLKFYTSGLNGFVDVRDVAEAMIMLMDSEVESERFVLVGENTDYKTLFTDIAKALDVPPPKIKATKGMAEMAWMLERIKSFLTGKPALVTKETARTSLARHYYNGEKISSYFDDFNYRPLKQSIREVGEMYKKDQPA